MAPFHTQEKWDNSGLLVGRGDAPVTGVLLTLDITPAAVEEAVRQGAELIVSHHPVIFQPLKRLDPDSPVYRMVQNGISAVCAHTNLDKAYGGVNDCLSERLGLKNVRVFGVDGREWYYKLVVFVPESHETAVRTAIVGAGAGTIGCYTGCTFSGAGIGRFRPEVGAQPWLGSVGAEEEAREIRLEAVVPAGQLDAVLAAMQAAHPYEEPAYDVFESVRQGREIAIGRLGELPAPLSPALFAAFAAKQLGASVRYNRSGREIHRVAVLGGAGGSYLYEAAAMGADALVTGEAKHHEYLDAEAMGVTLIDATHYATEQVVLGPLAQYLQERFPEVSFRLFSGGDVLDFIG